MFFFLASLPIAGLLTALIFNYVTYRLMQRTYPILGFVAGLLIMALLFALGHFAFVFNLRADIRYSGPLCDTCGLVGLPLAIWWLAWLVSAVFYVAASIRASLSLSGPDAGERAWPAGLWRWLGVFLIGVAALYLGNRLYRQSQIASLAQQIATLSPIETWQLTELGTMALPATKKIEVVPADVDVLQFSSNGRWLMTSQEYWDDVGIWQVSNLEERYSFPRCDNYNRHPAQFSPNGLRFAIRECDGQLSLYHLESGHREWSQPLAGEFIFTEDSQSLIILGDFVLIQVRVSDGHVIHEAALPEIYNHFTRMFSEDGNFLLIRELDEGRDDIYDTWTGLRLATLQGGELIGSSQVEEPIFFEYDLLWDGQLLQPARPDYDLVIEQAQAEGFSASRNLTPYGIFSDDKRLALFSARGVVVWSQTEERVTHFIPFQPYITAITLSPDQRLLVLATADARLHFLGEAP